jgi:hypothetical protein
VLYCYIAFVLMSWLASPLFNLLLRLNRFGRHALSPDQVRGANVLLVCLVVTLSWLAAAIWRGDAILWFATLLFAALSLPASGIFRSELGWPRITMTRSRWACWRHSGGHCAALDAPKPRCPNCCSPEDSSARSFRPDRLAICGQLSDERGQLLVPQSRHPILRVL